MISRWSRLARLQLCRVNDKAKPCGRRADTRTRTGKLRRLAGCWISSIDRPIRVNRRPPDCLRLPYRRTPTRLTPPFALPPRHAGPQRAPPGHGLSSRCQFVNKLLTMLLCPDEGRGGVVLRSIGNENSRFNLLFVAPPSRSAAGRLVH